MFLLKPKSLTQQRKDTQDLQISRATQLKRFSTSLQKLQVVVCPHSHLSLVQEQAEMKACASASLKTLVTKAETKLGSIHTKNLLQEATHNRIRGYKKTLPNKLI